MCVAAQRDQPPALAPCPLAGADPCHQKRLRTAAGCGETGSGRGPVRGPGRRIVPALRVPSVRLPVLSVQLARARTGIVPLIIRRSWVRAPPAPPESSCADVRMSVLTSIGCVTLAPSITSGTMNASIVPALRPSSGPSVCGMPSALASGPAAAEVPNRHRLGGDVVHHPVAPDAQPPSVR